MRLPRVLFTVRGMMVLVGIVSIILGALAERRGRFLAMSRSNAGMVSAWEGGGTELSFSELDYHAELAQKYADAARRPWLPVQSDPPRPVAHYDAPRFVLPFYRDKLQLPRRHD